MRIGGGDMEDYFQKGVDGVHGGVRPRSVVVPPGAIRRLLVDLSQLKGASYLVPGEFDIETRIVSGSRKTVGRSNRVKLVLVSPQSDRIPLTDERSQNSLTDQGTDVGRFDLGEFLSSYGDEKAVRKWPDSHRSQIAFHRAWRELLHADGNSSIEYHPSVMGARAESIASRETIILLFEDAKRRGDERAAATLRQEVELSMPDIAWRLKEADLGLGFRWYGQRKAAAAVRQHE